MLYTLIFIFLPISPPASAYEVQEEERIRIISLSPHLTEIVFALQQQQNLVAVSDYSDYPYPQGCIDSRCVHTVPSVASYQGANIADIIRLEPSIVLAWEGGNKAQDIARLEQLGYVIFRSSPANINDLMNEISDIGKLLNASTRSQTIVSEMQQQLKNLETQFKRNTTRALYYMNQQPLSGIGNDTWLNSLLSLCGISNIYQDLPTPYAQLSIADIIRKAPALVIAATHQDINVSKGFWRTHEAVFAPKIVQVNPDALHRFTPRVLPELAKLCKKVHF